MICLLIDEGLLILRSFIIRLKINMFLITIILILLSSSNLLLKSGFLLPSIILIARAAISNLTSSFIAIEDFLLIELLDRTLAC
jgi:hypothetical protein